MGESFDDRCAQLIADFQHAMDDAAPVTMPLMIELKSLFEEGCNAHADRDTMRAQNIAHATVAKQAAKQAADLVTTIGQITNR